jgi:putative SOS response-associated peptidase YedK
MCGRYSLIVTDDLGRRFRVHDPVIGIRSRFNVTPGASMPVVCAGDGRRLVQMQWGLVPFWAKDPAIGRRLINARSDTVAGKPAFRVSFAQKRCLVPASGFYEWKKTPEGKVPFYYRMKGGAPFAFAGLYDRWRAPGGEMVMTYTIITTEPNSLIARVHDRMPAILRMDDENPWLDRKTDTLQLSGMLAPFPADAMEAWEVSPRVNNPEYEGEDLIAPRVSRHGWW